MNSETNNLNISLLYLTLHNLLRRKYGEDKIISTKELYINLGKHFLVPKTLRKLLIKEMEQMGLIKKEKRNQIKILKLDYDLENNIGAFYKMLNLV